MKLLSSGIYWKSKRDARKTTLWKEWQAMIFMGTFERTQELLRDALQKGAL